MGVNTQNEDRVVILSRPETTYGQDAIGANLGANPTPFFTDALLVSALDVKANVTALERENYSPSLSQDQSGTGRTMVQLTFTHELRASGVLGVAPRIGRLLKACGFQETIIPNTPAATIGAPVAGINNTSAPAATIVAGITKTTAPTKCFDTYRLTVTTGGAPATAKFIVTSLGFPEGDTQTLNSLNHTYWTNSVAGTVSIGGTLVAPVITFAGTWAVRELVELFIGGIRFFYQVQTADTPTTVATAIKTLMLADGRFTGTNNAAGVLTVALTASAGEVTSSASAQPVTLGQSGGVISIPIWTGALVAGETFDIPLLRPGVRYDPVSDNITSLSFWVFLDGQMIPVTGARGTFQVSGQASAYPTVAFTFTGLYNEPVDYALPTSLGYELSKPFKAELAQLTIAGQPNVCASKYSFDLAADIAAKDCLNAAEGWDEVRFTDRKPSLGVDPEAAKPSIANPWTRMVRGDVMRFHVANGIKGGPGNIVRIQADAVQLADAPFANRTKVRALQYTMRVSRVQARGDDECFFHFS